MADHPRASKGQAPLLQPTMQGSVSTRRLRAGASPCTIKSRGRYRYEMAEAVTRFWIGPLKRPSRRSFLGKITRTGFGVPCRLPSTNLLMAGPDYFRLADHPSGTRLMQYEQPTVRKQVALRYMAPREKHVAEAHRHRRIRAELAAARLITPESDTLLNLALWVTRIGQSQQASICS